jgi:uncharacterized protein YbbC (DUF1343 family)
MLDPAFKSFIGAVPLPLVYAMTPAEAAGWMNRNLGLGVRLHTARMRRYGRQADWRLCWPWISPSPGIRSWESAAVYPATVFLEAIPAVDFGRGTIFPFQVVGAPWLRATALRDALEQHGLPGVGFRMQPYVPGAGPYEGKPVRGIRIVVLNPSTFRPVETAVALLHQLQRIHGRNAVWHSPEARMDHFDRLAGTDRLRRAIYDGVSPRDIADSWRSDLRKFDGTRRKSLLYRAT